MAVLDTTTLPAYRPARYDRGVGVTFASSERRSAAGPPYSEVVTMRTQTGLNPILACMLICLFFSGARVRAQAAQAAKDDTKAIKSMVEDSIGWYQVFADASAPEAMTPHPVLRWRNATRGTQETEGVFVLWVNKGRPEASASIFPFEGVLHHEFVSLSRVRNCRHGRTVGWSGHPRARESSSKTYLKLPAPAETPAARLRQLKSAAGRFKVSLTGWRGDKPDREELRMLPTVIYREEVSEASRADPSWIDGGVFAFVQGTDPEAILVLEVVRDRNGRPLWRYGFSRATSSGLLARLDKTVVWVVDSLAGEQTPGRPEIGFFRSPARPARNSKNLP